MPPFSGVGKHPDFQVALFLCFVSKDELGKDFQGCFLPNIPIESIINRYSKKEY